MDEKSFILKNQKVVFVENLVSIEKDWEELAMVHHEVYHKTSEDYRAEELKYFPLEKFEKGFKKVELNGKNVLFVARYQDETKENKICGFARLGEYNNKIIQLHQDYVSPQGIGIGSVLLYNAFQWVLSNSKYTKIRVEINSYNNNSRGFHKYLGAELIDTGIDLDVEKGNYGAPQDITSPTDILIIDNIQKAFDILKEKVNEVENVHSR